MAQQTINVGVSANDGGGDTLRASMQKINANFTETYGNDFIDSAQIVQNAVGERELNVGAGTGINVAADSVAVEGASTLTTNNVPKWDGSGFTNSSISDNGTTVTITNNLDVQGTITYIDSTTVEFGDNILLLAKDQTGTPALNAGFEVERGDSANVSFLWVEGSDYFYNRPTFPYWLYCGSRSRI